MNFNNKSDNLQVFQVFKAGGVMEKKYHAGDILKLLNYK